MGEFNTRPGVYSRKYGTKRYQWYQEISRGISFKRRVFWRKNLISLGTFPFALCNLTFTDKLLVKGQNNIIYYIDTSVLRENIPLVKFIKTTSGNRVVYFP